MHRNKLCSLWGVRLYRLAGKQNAIHAVGDISADDSEVCYLPATHFCGNLPADDREIWYFPAIYTVVVIYLQMTV